MAHPIRIAICYSGLTRNFNHQDGNKEVSIRESNQNFFYEVRKQLVKQMTGRHSPEPVVTMDNFGHTWDQCELPDPLHTQVAFKQSNQKEIWEWVRQDLAHRLPYKVGWDETHKFSTLTDKQLMEFYEKVSPMAYGQIVSAFHAYNLVPTAEYDIVLRMRWDVRMGKKYWYDEERLSQDQREEMTQYYSDFAHQLLMIFNDFSYHSQVNGTHYQIHNWEAETYLTSNVGLNYNSDGISTSPDDLFFAHTVRFNKSRWLKENPYKVLGLWAEKNTYKSGRSTSHSLWNDIFKIVKLKGLPLFDGRMIRIERDYKKVNTFDI